MNELSSPLTTLFANTSPHDIQDAYHTLSIRLINLIPNSPPLPSNQLVQSLTRDIEGARINPLPLSSSSVLNLTPVDIKRATDSVHVSHAALNLVSLLFRFESLYRVFPGIPFRTTHLKSLTFPLVPDLRALLHSILSLAPTTTHLPTPNSHKTRALVVWILQSQRLPAEVILGDHELTDDIVRVLRGVFAGDMQGKIVSDALKVIHI
jgi:hypothetical protein